MMNEIIAWSVNLFARLAVHLRLISVELKPKKKKYANLVIINVICLI